MDREIFLDNFVTQFLASYSNSVYMDCCQRGDHDRLYNPPIEDALFIGEEVWEKLLSIKNNRGSKFKVNLEEGSKLKLSWIDDKGNFGEIGIFKKDGEAICDSEALSKETVKKLLESLVDDIKIQ